MSSHAQFSIQSTAGAVPVRNEKGINYSSIFTASKVKTNHFCY